MKLLAIDTCGPVIAVGVWAEDRVYERTERVTRGAEARLMPWAVQLCGQAGFALDQVDGVVVASGPGAFTGLRVGLASACGVALAANVSVWAGSSLHSRAWPHLAVGPVLSMLDARKSRVYAQLFGASAMGPADIAPDLALAWPDGEFLAVGEGAVVYQSLVEAAGGIVVEDPSNPNISGLLAMGLAGFGRGEGVSPEQAHPTYLRDADAKVPKGLRTP